MDGVELKAVEVGKAHPSSFVIRPLDYRTPMPINCDDEDMIIQDGSVSTINS
ncbi:hypothetical protein CGRA01v4_09704 [Colletotrichum graminicola]|nr:hypothetical protein CGRA01v4_09704 [Colletotrichum graminicola]